jgi:hypothetical protein
MNSKLPWYVDNARVDGIESNQIVIRASAKVFATTDVVAVVSRRADAELIAQAVNQVGSVPDSVGEASTITAQERSAKENLQPASPLHPETVEAARHVLERIGGFKVGASHAIDRTYVDALIAAVRADEHAKQQERMITGIGPSVSLDDLIGDGYTYSLDAVKQISDLVRAEGAAQIAGIISALGPEHETDDEAPMVPYCNYCNAAKPHHKPECVWNAVRQSQAEARVSAFEQQIKGHDRG